MVAVRRFEPGFSTEFYALQIFLARYGYELSGQGSWGFGLCLFGKKPKRMQWAKVIEFVDGVRVANGLEPIRRAI